MDNTLLFLDSFVPILQQNFLSLMKLPENIVQSIQKDNSMSDQSVEKINALVKEFCPIELVAVEENLNKPSCNNLTQTKSDTKFEKKNNGILIKNEIISDDEDEDNYEEENVYSQIDELVEADNMFDNSDKFKKFSSRIRKSVPIKLNTNNSNVLTTIKTVKNASNKQSTSMSTKEFFKKQNLKQQLKIENKVNNEILLNIKNDKCLNIVKNTDKINNSISTLLNEKTSCSIDPVTFDDNTTLQTVIQSSFIKTNLSEV